MRVRVDVCRAVLVTSIVWFLVDVFVLFYFLDPGATPKKADVRTRGERDGVEEAAPLRVLDRVDEHKEERKRKDEPESEPADPRVDGLLGRLMKGLSFGSGGPGEMGRAVHNDPAKEAERKEKFKLNQFNVMASDAISLNRTLPDYRSARCREMATEYEKKRLPPTSIIIVFHNEAWSTLLRTLHSVVNRSPLTILKEIILVDDLSERDYLREPLDVYIKKFRVPVKLIHLDKRSGLIQARLRGSSVATGEILLFLDAHVEVTEGWLEPLVVRVAENRKRVVAPIIDVISDETFEYVTASDTTWGGFNWHLNFRWYQVPPREMERRQQDRASPIQTPTIAGGLFAINRDYFYELGSYDEGMEVWGGENLEISFRTWMCGGVLEIIPCSRVGHVFRKQTPYTFPGGTSRVIHHNAARTAEVWMDDYKIFFYKMTPAARNVEVGDVTGRRALRQSLKCKSFKWYLETIYPEAPVPVTYLSVGSIANPNSRMCIDTMGRAAGENPGVTACHSMGGNQAWSLTGHGELRADEHCLSPGGSFSHGAVKLEKCALTDVSPKHVWQYSPQTKLVIHHETKECLTLDGQQLILKACSPESSQQLWILENYKADAERSEH
uniref:Polypeptide N-acetylgalactosaminyltransferase n=1 Tax=Plectus sambesii TaxID=2011161 RepID=A0A914WY15_9BILA